MKDERRFLLPFYALCVLYCALSFRTKPEANQGGVKGNISMKHQKRAQRTWN
jgi:hypothetical protein